MKKHKRVHLDVTDKQLKGVSIGESITVTVRGKVISLEAEREYSMCCGPGDKEEKEKYPARLEMEVASMKVGDSNAFAKMAQSDLDETEEN